MRRTPIGFEKEEEENLKQILETGVIKESSDCASAPVLVRKKHITFQRVIQFVLRDLTWNKILAYLDDVIVLGKDFQDHMRGPQWPSG